MAKKKQAKKKDAGGTTDKWLFTATPGVKQILDEMVKEQGYKGRNPLIESILRKNRSFQNMAKQLGIVLPERSSRGGDFRSKEYREGKD